MEKEMWTISFLTQSKTGAGMVDNNGLFFVEENEAPVTKILNILNQLIKENQIDINEPVDILMNKYEFGVLKKRDLSNLYYEKTNLLRP